MGPFSLANLDLKQLRTFVAVVEHEGVSAAALSMGVGLSSVSRALTGLETRLGVRLCQRGRSGFLLTEQGQEVYGAAVRMFQSMKEFESAVLTTRRAVAGKLEVGVIDNLLSAGSCGLVRALDALHQEHPDILIKVSVLVPSVIEVQVRERRLDFALTGQPQWLQPLVYRLAAVEEDRLYVARSSPHFVHLAQALSRPGGPSEAIPYIERDYRADQINAFERTWPLKVVGSGNSIEAVATLVASGLGCGILPGHYVDALGAHDLVGFDVPGAELRVPIYIVYRRDAAYQPALNALIRRFGAPGGDACVEMQA